jgi:hypothetical protein
MGEDVRLVMIEVFIQKPSYDSFVYVRDIYITRAEKTNQLLRIKTPKHERICSAAEWKQGAKVMKKVFLKPDEPMILWGNYVTKNPEPKNQPRLVADMIK